MLSKPGILTKALAIILLLIGFVGAAAAQGVEVVEFNGTFVEGQIIRDEYMFRGLRLPPHADGGPYYDDGGLLGFFFETPPGLLSLNPLSFSGGPGQVHASVGTYEFDFVDPTNPFVPGFTDQVAVTVVLIDKGDTVLTAYDADGQVLGSQTLSLSSFTFDAQVLNVGAPGIRRATLTTPLVQPTIGALVDTVRYTTPPEMPSRAIDIDIRPGSSRNSIRLTSNLHSTVNVAILSSPGFDPALLDPAMVLFQQASPISGTLMDRNRDRVRDLILAFRVADLRGLTPSSSEAHLTAVDADGTSLKGSDSVMVRSGQMPIGPSGSNQSTGRLTYRGTR